MWKKLYEVLTRLFALTQKVERHDKEIVELEMKYMHERLVGRAEIEQDSFFARLLLNDLKKRITIMNNSGKVMIDSPGAIQGETINVHTAKRKISVNAPPGSIGGDINLTGYIQHLIERYNKFASEGRAGHDRFSYGAISKNIADKFGAQWKLLSIEKASELIGYIQQRISRTRQARTNIGRGWLTSSRSASWDEFARWISIFRPEILYLVGCQTGLSEAVNQLSLNLETVKEIYGSTSTIGKMSARLIYSAIAEPHLRRSPSRGIAYAISAAFLPMTDIVFDRWRC